MKRIKQIEESKKMIAGALIELLETNVFEDITISQIAAEAKFARNTFYNNFSNKEDVLEYVWGKYLDEAISVFLKKSNPTLFDILLWRFTVIKKTPHFYYFRRERDVLNMLLQLKKKAAPIINLMGSEDEYTKDFIMGGIDYVTSSWIRNGMKESPRDIAEKVMSLIEK